jgi:replicative DNA helicase
MSALLHNQRVEVLAMASMLDSDVEVVQLALEAGLRESHFYTDASLAAFRRIKKLRRQDRDPTWDMILADLSIPDEHRKRLAALSNNLRIVQTRREAQEALTTLEDHRKIRGMYELAKSVFETLDTDKEINVDAEVQKAAKQFEFLQQNTEVSAHDEKATDAKVIGIIDGLKEGNDKRIIRTGMKEFDERNGGVYRGTNFTIGAPSGHGKSHMALNLALNMARGGYRVCFVSLEMPDDMVWPRVMAYLTGVSYSALQLRQITPQQYEWVKDSYHVFKESLRRMGACFRVVAEESFSMTELLASLAPYKYDVIVIDYLTLLTGMRDQDYWMRIGEAAAEAQTYAIKNDAVVISVVQTDDDGKARLSQQIKDNAGLMWVWTGDSNDTKKEKEAKTDFDKKAIDFIDVEMPKGRAYQRFTMRLYRSTGHSQHYHDTKDLQKPWIYKFPQANDIFKQRPWENGIAEGEEQQRKAEATRRKRYERFKAKKARETIEFRAPSEEMVSRLIERQSYLRPSAIRTDHDAPRVKYYNDNDPSPPSYYNHSSRRRA